MKTSKRDAQAELKQLMRSPDWAALKTVPPMMLQVRSDQAIMLLTLLQLALRHPKNNGASADFGRELGLTIQKHISINPTIARVCERGWDPDFDIEI